MKENEVTRVRRIKKMIAKREKIDANERRGSPYCATTVTGAT